MEGKYYTIVAMCDPSTSNLNVTGEITVMNPYGHLPARMYGLLPFTRSLLFVYSFITLFWIYRCIRYYKEMMSVHYIISTVIAVFLIDTCVKLINLHSYNTRGTYVTVISIISITITTATHAISRCLTLLIAMG